jgi:hypothetical protein
MTNAWERRLRRAVQLEKEWPFAADILRLYRSLLPIQARIHAEAAGKFPPDETFTPWFMDRLCDLVDRVAAEGPGTLAEEAARWRGHVEDRWWEEHGRPHQPDPLCEDCPSPLYHFLGTVFDQPLKMSVRPENFPAASGDTGCPSCGRSPLVSVLREDRVAETVRRSLVCSFCTTEWEFPRVVCPKCREERPEKLPRFTALEIPWMRVDACDTCRGYLKSVDLTKNPDAEPVVDELGSTPLDVIAREQGYSKLAANLAGV